MCNIYLPRKRKIQEEVEEREDEAENTRSIEVAEICTFNQNHSSHRKKSPAWHHLSLGDSTGICVC